jgi:hypothetical protein
LNVPKHAEPVLVWLSVLLELQLEGWAVLGNWSSFDVYCTGSHKWWAGVVSAHEPMLGRRRRDFYFIFLVGVLCIKLRLKAIVWWGIDR